MKIVELVNNWPAEVFILRHIQALNDEGLAPFVVSRANDKEYAKSASIGNCQTPAQVLPNFNHLSPMEKILNLKYLINMPLMGNNINLGIGDRVLLGYFDKIKPDLIHFHNAGLAVSMHWIPELLRIPYTVSLRGSDIQVNPLLSDGYRERLNETLEKSAGIHSVCDAIWKTALSTNTGGLVNKFHKTIFTTVPIQKMSELRTKKSTNHTFHLVSSGRLHWTKAYPRLLSAFRDVLAKGIDAKLTIIGDGPEKENLLYWAHFLNIEAKVLFTGKLSYECLASVLTDSDAYIQSSIAEGFSNAVAESMALGVPVFATDVGGTSEIIQEGITGFLLDPFASHLWVEKIAKVIDLSTMEKIKENAWNTANKRFSAKKHTKEFIDFYTTAMDEPINV